MSVAIGRREASFDTQKNNIYFEVKFDKMRLCALFAMYKRAFVTLV